MRRRLYPSVPVFLMIMAVSGSRSITAQFTTAGISLCSVSYSYPLLPHDVPYVAATRSSLEQRLADGNVVHESVESTHARDGSGRIMEQHARECQRPDSSETGSTIEVMVSDPKARTTTTWILGPRSTHVAYLRHQPEIVHRDVQPMRPPMIETFPKGAPVRNEETSEQLGTRTIAGVQATGERWTRIIPSGADGNDLPMKVVRESWNSQNPRILLMTSDDDPRFGHRVWEVTSLSLGEPDPSLFAPPQGYTVEEGTPIERPESRGVKGSPSTAGSSTSTTGTLATPR